MIAFYKIIPWTSDTAPTPLFELFTPEIADKVRAYHKSYPEYAPTKLRRDGNIFIKDESSRFGLNAFKVLGGSYAIGNIVARKAGLTEMTCQSLTAPETKRKTGELTFITATDGNHGRGVAWTASRLNYKSVVYLPKGSADERVENIRACGADAFVTDMNYDDTVRRAQYIATRNGWILTQDTIVDGNDEIPTWIMQGYLTMGAEIVAQLGAVRPTHIFLQAGVGSMAAAMAAFFANVYRDNMPKIIVVEPHKADCFFSTAEANDGRLHTVSGKMDTIMAGLACGEPCPAAWEILSRTATAFMSIHDSRAEKAMRALHRLGIISGESGSAGYACAAIARESGLFGVNKDSVVLTISTEGATDKKNYERIVLGD